LVIYDILYLIPKGKNYIIKNVKGRDEIVVKHLDGQNNDTLTTSILADYVADVGFKKIVGDDRYLGLVRNIIDSKDIEIKAIVDKHKKTGKKSSELFNTWTKVISLAFASASSSVPLVLLTVVLSSVNSKQSGFFMVRKDYLYI
jgi:hypothetical protein